MEHLSALAEIVNRHNPPNFFCSAEFLAHKGCSVFRGKNGGIWAAEKEFPSCAIIPPVGDLPEEVEEIWSDTDGWEPPKEESLADWEKEFLDWEFWFDPKRFKDMSGGGWAKFRKNSRKWPRRILFGYEYRPLLGSHRGEIADLLERWLLGEKAQEEIYDLEVMFDYLMNPINENIRRMGLFKIATFDRTLKVLVGINAWDENLWAINYRYCITDPEERSNFIDEFCRLNFYLGVADSGKLVNDGGSLGKEGLERYKESLNPVKKRPVYRWKRRTREGGHPK
jgi:hypothetical protein